jgi:predicted nucleotidyltransferase
MAHHNNPNLEILILAVARLGKLTERMVFLGGCATGLLLTDPAAPEPRPTQDVDVLTEVLSLADYYRLADELRQAGFAEDQTEDAPVCRWRSEGVILDVMPTDPRILGFGNQWYASALKASELIDLPSETSIRVVTAPYFLATKLEAFDGRGNGDFLLSHDIEDLVALVDGRTELVDEVLQADELLRSYLAARFTALLDSTSFLDALPGHLPPDSASQARLPLLLERFRAIAES